MRPVNVQEKFRLFSTQWDPKVIAGVNDYHVKIARIEGEFTRHKHDETDEMFFVVEGNIRIDTDDEHIDVGEGELFVVPKGVYHKPVAEKEAKIMMFEPAGTLNTGDVEDAYTKHKVDWI